MNNFYWCLHDSERLCDRDDCVDCPIRLEYIKKEYADLKSKLKI